MSEMGFSLNNRPKQICLADSTQQEISVSQISDLNLPNLIKKKK